MALKVGELFATLGLDDKKFNKGMSGAGSKFKKFGKIAAAGAAAGAAALAGVAVAATKMAADFEADMANVNTLLGGNAERTDELGEAVKQLSVETGKPLDDLAGGLYQVVSAFGDSADTAEILEIAAKSSAAGLATTEDAVNLLSAVTKGYGDTSAEAVQKVSDMAFQTVKLGQTTFPELAASMGKAVPLFASMGGETEELFGAMATLTGVTGNTAEVSTQLRGIMSSLAKPTDAMKEAIKKLGYESGQAMLESEGFQGTLELLKQSAGGNTEQMAEMFGRVEALNGVLALTGDQAENFTKKTQAMYEAGGASAEAFAIQQDSVNAMMGRVKQLANVLMVELGEKLLPILSDLLKWVIDHMPEIQATFETVFGSISTAVNWISEKLLPIFKDVFGSIYAYLQGDWTKSGELIWSVIDKAVNLIDEILQNLWGSVFKEPVMEAYNETVKYFSEMKTKIMEYVQDTIDGIKEWFGESKLGKAVETVSGVTDKVTGFFGKMADVLVGHSIVPDMVDDILGEFDRMGEGMKSRTEQAKVYVEDILSSMQEDINSEKLFANLFGEEYTPEQEASRIKSAIKSLIERGADPEGSLVQYLLGEYSELEEGIRATEAAKQAAEKALQEQKDMYIQYGQTRLADEQEFAKKNEQIKAQEAEKMAKWYHTYSVTRMTDEQNAAKKLEEIAQQNAQKMADWYHTYSVTRMADEAEAAAKAEELAKQQAQQMTKWYKTYSVTRTKNEQDALAKQAKLEKEKIDKITAMYQKYGQTRMADEQEYLRRQQENNAKMTAWYTEYSQSRMADEQAFLERSKTSWQVFSEGVKFAIADMTKTSKEYYADLATTMVTTTKDTFADILRGTKSVTQAFKSLWERVIDIVIDKLASIAASKVFNWILGGFSGGGLFSGIFGAIGSIFGLAEGGTTTSAGAVMVGERGPEILNLPKGATVTPLNKTGGVANITVMLDSETIARKIGAPLVDEIRVRTALA